MDQNKCHDKLPDKVGREERERERVKTGKREVGNGKRGKGADCELDFSCFTIRQAENLL